LLKKEKHGTRIAHIVDLSLSLSKIQEKLLNSCFSFPFLFATNFFSLILHRNRLEQPVSRLQEEKTKRFFVAGGVFLTQRDFRRGRSREDGFEIKR
jgi:hypothetical protein